MEDEGDHGLLRELKRQASAMLTQTLSSFRAADMHPQIQARLMAVVTAVRGASLPLSQQQGGLVRMMSAKVRREGAVGLPASMNGPVLFMALAPW